MAGAALVAALAFAAPAAAATYDVGAATRDITPTGRRQPRRLRPRHRQRWSRTRSSAAAARARRRTSGSPRARSSSAEKKTAIAIADIETQGMFAAYEDGPYGLDDIAQTVEQRTKGKLPADHVLIASDHTHSGPDTIGAWGGVSDEYLQYIHDQTVDAIVAAFNSRRKANVRAGHSDASDLIYNQSCSEALNQDKEPAYPGPEVCATPGKDGMVRVVQATDPKSGSVIATFMAYAAHATAGGGNGLHGDWPQFLSNKMSARARRRRAGDGRRARRDAAVPFGVRVHEPVQPRLRRSTTASRRSCSNYFAHVAERARRRRRRSSGPIDAAKSFIREPITGPGGARALHGRQLRRRAPAALAPEPVGRRQHDPHRHVCAARRRRALLRHARRGLPRDRRRASATRSPTSRRSSSSASRTTSSAT